MSFTSQLNNLLLNHVFRNEPYQSPASVYVALFTSADTEVSGNGYTRKKITFSAPVNGEIKSDEEVRFPIATANWGAITHGAIFDSETGGTRLEQAVISDERVVREGDQFIVRVGNYRISIKEMPNGATTQSTMTGDVDA